VISRLSPEIWVRIERFGDAAAHVIDRAPHARTRGSLTLPRV
jgi:hypothetical protein